MKVAYRGACARIDRLEGPKDTEQTENAPSVSDIVATGTNRTIATASVTTSLRARESGEVEQDPLAAEFTTTPKLFNLAYKVANEQANHRREPRYRPRHKQHRGEKRSKSIRS